MPSWRERYETLQVPSWVPDDVRYLVQEHWGEESGDPEQIALVQRLLIDARMEAVWRELLLRNRKTGDYLHVADNMKALLGNDRANEVYPVATAVVFQRAVVVGISAMKMNEQKSGCYLQQAAELRKDADLLRQMMKEHRLDSGFVDDVRRSAGQIVEAAEAYDRLRRQAETGLFDEARSKGFAIEISKTMRGLFREALYGTVTTITRVALNDDTIKKARVREWLTL
jgi:hypothetical protein